MKIFVVGSLNMDLTIGAPRMPQKGETVSGGGFMVTSGGKGANQAVAAGKLGGDVLMVGCVGNTFGGELLDSLRSAGVDTRFVEERTGVPGGTAVIVVTDGDNRIILDRGANAEVSKEQIDRALDGAQEGDYLVAQLEIGLDIVAYALRRGKERGLITVLNPAPAAALDDSVFADCDYLIPNQSEAEFYTGIYPRDAESAKACAAVLAGKGVKHVLITMGELGSVCVSGGEFIGVEACTVKAVDTTAAGDTYVGALVTRLAEGAQIGEAMRFASRASAIAVTRRGAQASIPDRKEVDVL